MRIRLYNKPFVVAEPKVFYAESVGEWLLDYYGKSPQVRVQVFEGEPCLDNEITDNVKALVANTCEEYVVLESPGTGVEPWLLNIIISVALSVVASLLAPSPELPSNVNRNQQSPNNSLGQRENKVRFAERVEDIYGTVKSIPSLMMPTYLKYIHHRKFEYGYYCVGRGYYDIADIKDGDSLISSITGASASVYKPFTSPNSGDSPYIKVGEAIPDDVVTAKRSVEVDGVLLKALNQIQMPNIARYKFTPDPAGGLITQASKNPNFSAMASVGDTFTVTMADFIAIDQPSVSQSVTTSGNAFTGNDGFVFTDIVVGDSVTIVGGSNNGVRNVTSKPSSSQIVVDGAALVSEIVTAISFSVTRNYSGAYEVAEVFGSEIRVTIASSSFWKTTLGAVFPFPFPEASLLFNNRTEYTTWVTLPLADRDRVWANIVAANGMYKDDGGKSTTSVNFSIEIEKLDAITFIPTGIVEIINSSLSGSVTEERAATVEHTTSWVGPARVRMRRTTPVDYDFQGTVVDEIKWVDLYSVSPANKTEFGNKTTIHTVTEATARATAIKTRQLNCIASRKLPIYNGSIFSGSFDSTGLLATGTISATSKLVDIIAAVSVDPLIGRRDLTTEVDINQIYGVQQQLDAWSSDAGQFNYTFDSDNTSFEETVITIANAGFCLAYRQNGKIRLAFDKQQSNSTALFTHRNKKPTGESITRRFANDADYDGVEFVYSDPTTFQSETIKLPLDNSSVKPKKFEIAGIRSFTQAWYRANREYQKLIGQRVSIETETTMDARSLLPNSRVDIVDNTRFKSYDGEIVAQNGLELTLSQAVEFTPSLPHSILLMRRDGSLQSITVTQGSTDKKVILQSLPSEAIVTQYGQEGVRTIFSFAADSVRGALAYLVQEVDLSDSQYIKIKAINYSDNYYSADTQTIPDKNLIISGTQASPVPQTFLLTEDGNTLITDDGNIYIQG